MKTVKVKCPDCGDIIFSSYEGEFVTCSCFQDGEKGIFIDQNRYIFRTTVNAILVEEE